MDEWEDVAPGVKIGKPDEWEDVDIPVRRTPTMSPQAEADLAASNKFSPYGFVDQMSNSALPFVDEITAGVTSPVLAARRAAFDGQPFDVGQAYDDRLAVLRAKRSGYEEENPAQSAAASVIGGVASVPLAGVGKSLMGTMGRGAIENGIYGFSEGEGFDDRLTQGGIGAAFGAAFPLLVEGGRAGVNFVRNSIVPPTGERALNRAQEVIMRALGRDQLSVDDVAARLSRAEELAKQRGLPAQPLNMADVAGENTRGIVAGAAAIPSAGKAQAIETLNERMFGQMDRIGDDARRLTGLAKENRFMMADDINAQMRTAAKPLYDAAYASSEAIDDPIVLRMLDVPDVRKAFGDAVSIHQNEQAARLALGEDVKGLVPIVEKQGDEWVKTGLFPDMQTADYLKRALDDNITKLYKAGEGGRAGALKGVRDAIVARLDEISPDYKAARQVWAGGKEMDGALEMSNRFMAMSPDELASTWSKMSDGEKQVFRLGAFSKVTEAMGNTQDGADITRKIAGNPNVREKMKILFPDDQSYGSFMERMTGESAMAQTRNKVVSGSRTAPLQQEIQDIQGVQPSELIDFGRQSAQGGVVGATVNLVANKAKALASRGMGDSATEVSDEIIRRTLSPLNADQATILKGQMGDFWRKKLEADLKRQGYGRIAGAAAARQAAD